jgi:hypothetical protein
MLNQIVLPEDTASDHAELVAIDQLMGTLPDHLLVIHGQRAGKTAAVEFRVRASAAFRTLDDITAIISAMPDGAARRDLTRVLKRWRSTRARITERLRRR